jgi:hypothetical protein
MKTLFVVRSRQAGLFATGYRRLPVKSSPGGRRLDWGESIAVDRNELYGSEQADILLPEEVPGQCQYGSLKDQRSCFPDRRLRGRRRPTSSAHCRLYAHAPSESAAFRTSSPEKPRRFRH